ncbi:hypothetical protein NQ314_016620 [Rhamnusium bicolor]|uniref:Uncharacterized protein n=1 Tax=Rhamnusium bicolor TaxID=1586634 RepID=A0AAV8WVZ3_9CUCU|nr:hypothetical protein NQ314_016620 [Rhamnusium bicolor]
MKDKEYTAIDMESESLLEHDSLAQNYQEQASPIEMVLPAGANVDDPIPLDLESGMDKKPYDLESLQTKVLHSKYNIYIPTQRKDPEEKKVDENGNALHENPGTKAKKKKTQTDKNVVVLTAENVEGHRSDIINDVDKLIQYIGGDKDNISSGKTKSNVHKSKQLHKQHTSEDGGRNKKQRAHSSKGKESRAELKKSNSLGEISMAKLDEFAFASGSEKNSESKVVLRSNKGQNDRPKERRSWGNVEIGIKSNHFQPPPIQSLYSNVSAENLETSENWVVTKPKKKSKKRRNSVSSGRRQNSTSDSNAKQHANRAPSPDLRGKSACSVPHSEKSNDSSDVDSVHSLPIDGLNMPISYADIAKNSEKLKEKKVSPDKFEKVPIKEKSPIKVEIEPKPEVKVIQTIIHSKEKESIQFNAQMLPLDIPDVQTIEKNAFHESPSTKPTAIFSESIATTNYSTSAPGSSASPGGPSYTHTSGEHHPECSSGERHQNIVTNDININNVNCDSSERTISEDEEGPPPVVILSGIGNKEVPGLVFGFDVNEQLLNEDICENFISRYVAPEVFSHSSHNHDKIVNFIGSAKILDCFLENLFSHL